jgi:hypothetical protein
VDVGQTLGDPRIHEGQVRGPVAVLLPLAHVRPELTPVHPAATAVGGHERRHLLRRRHQHPRDRRQVRKGVALQQDLGVLRRECVSPLGGRERRVVDLEHPGDRLLLEPFPGVPLGDPRATRQIGRRRRPVGEGRVQPQSVTQVDREDLHRADQRSEDPLR